MARRMYVCTNEQTHNAFNGPLSRTIRVSQYQEGKPIWISLKQETVSGSGISWAICKSAPRSRQITMPASQHPVFLQAECPSCCPTNGVKALKAQTNRITQKQCPQPNPLDEQRHKNQLLPLTTARRGGMFNIAYSSSSGSVSSPAFSTTQPQDISSSRHIIGVVNTV